MRGLGAGNETKMLAAKGLNSEVIRCKSYWKISNARSMLLFIPSKWLYRVLQRIRVFQVTDIFQLLSIHMLIIDGITLFISPLLGGRQFDGK